MLLLPALSLPPSLTHSLPHSLTHSLIHLLLPHFLSCLLAYRPSHLHPLTHSPTHPLHLTFLLPKGPFTHSLTHHSLTHSHHEVRTITITTAASRYCVATLTPPLHTRQNHLHTPTPSLPHSFPHKHPRKTTITVTATLTHSPYIRYPF